ncbi:MAG: TonB family protein [Acidobacteria bacterium]|nr:TonB family protein [Acidobacteriota bacterium]
MRISIRIPRGAATDLGPTMASSLLAHLTAVAGLSLLPSFLPAGSLASAVYTVELVDLPPARGRESTAGPERPPSARTEETTRPPETKPVPVREADPAPRSPAPPEPAARKPVHKPEKPAPRPETPAASGAAAETPPAAPDQEPAEAGPSPAEGPASGPGGAGMGEQAGTGSFDDAAFRFAYYRSLMRNALRAQWSKPLYPPGAVGNLRAAVHFFIARDGTILELELAESSGYPPLDLSALRAVRDVGRMPPLPQEYDKDRVGVQYIFELKPED